MRNATMAAFSAIAIVAVAAELGRSSPPFSMERVDGTAIQLKSYAGKLVALAFIDTECLHCQDLTRVLVPIAREYRPKGVQVLECAFNEEAKRTMPQFLSKFQPSFPIGLTSRALVISYLRYPNADTQPFYTPHMVFLDRKGVIRSERAGTSEFFKDADKSIRTELNRLLNPAADRGSSGSEAR